MNPSSLNEGQGISLNIGEEFSKLARQRPGATAVVKAERARFRSSLKYESLTFGRCLELANCYACGLQDYGIQSSDTVLMLMKPVPDLAPVFLALWKIGAVPLVLDGGGDREQKLKLIEESAPKGLIGIPLSHALRVYYRKAFGSVSHPVTTRYSWLTGAPSLDSFRRRTASGPCAPAGSTAEDLMAIVFTSGSTGPAKGVVYTHGNGAAIVESMKHSLGIGPGDVCLAGHPAFAMHFLGAGATAVMPAFDPRYPSTADPAGLLAVIRDWQPAVAFLQLPLIRNLARYCAVTGQRIPHLRKILTTGASVGIDLIEHLLPHLEEPDADLHIMYGSTEALCVSFATGRDLLARAAKTNAGGGTYLGRVSPGVRVSIIEITGGAFGQWSPKLALPPSRIGEICVRGPMVTPEYYGHPEATRLAKIQDGESLWHRMGDAGYIDAQGGLWFCGRISDRVETERGYLYSDLVEPIFNCHPKVARSALIGVSVPGSSRKHPVVLIETQPHGSRPSPASHGLVIDALRSLAGQHDRSDDLQDIRISSKPFPVDIRHGAKIRRDLLAGYAAHQNGRAASEFPARQTISFKNWRVAYYEQGRGEPILFLHNAGNDHTIWEHQTEFLSRDHRVIAVDSLGYGTSDNPAIDYSLPLYTEMVSALVDSLALAPVTIIGNCTGSAMALNYALKNPGKVKRLILFHIATEKTAAGGSLDRMIRLVGGRPWLTRAICPFVEAAMSCGLLHERILSDQYGGVFTDGSLFLSHMHRLYRKRRQATCLLRLFSNWESLAVLDQIKYPAGFPPLHVFWGDANRVLPLEAGRKLCASLQPHSLDVIEGAGHLAMRERPESINRRLDGIMRAEDPC